MLREIEKPRCFPKTARSKFIQYVICISFHFTILAVSPSRRYINCSTMPKDSEKKFRKQSYRKEWEKEDWAKGWLCSSKYNLTKAFCSLCSKYLVPGKSELIGHSKAQLHLRNAKTVKVPQPMTAFVTSNKSAVMKAELML